MAPHYVAGDFNAVCDVCGGQFKGSQLRTRWDSLMVCPADYEERHPQDLIRGIEDRQSTPFSRPRPEPVFITPGKSDGSHL